MFLMCVPSEDLTWTQNTILQQQQILTRLCATIIHLKLYGSFDVIPRIKEGSKTYVQTEKVEAEI